MRDVSTPSFELRGRGLLHGQPCLVRLSRCDGATRIRFGDESCALSECTPRAALLSTELILPSGRALATVEHFAAAAAGLGLHEGVLLDVREGDELPLLDGSAAAWTEALAALACPASSPRLQIRRSHSLEVDGAHYTFEPADRTEVEVELRTEHTLLERHARWQGDAATFTRELAPARTFAFESDLEAYAARGLRPHVAPEQVVIVGAELQTAGPAATPSEPVRHKLLDLLGDLFLHGGPPRGVVRARAPGHQKTHRAMRMAWRAGVLASVLCVSSVGSARAEGTRFVPSPLTLPTLDHRRPEIGADLRFGFLQSTSPALRQSGALMRYGVSGELPILPRRVYLGARYAFAAGHSMSAGGEGAMVTTGNGAMVSGNTQLTIRSIWVAPAGLALGGAFDLTLPTAYYRGDTTAGDVANAARALSPNDWLSFWQRSVGFRPSFDVRIRAAGFTFQLRQSLSFAAGVAEGKDSTMIAEVGLYAGQQLGPFQLGMEVAELYYIDNVFTGAATRSDSSRARFAAMPQVRLVQGAVRPSMGILYSPQSAYDDTRVLALHLNVDFAL